MYCHKLNRKNINSFERVLDEYHARRGRQVKRASRGVRMRRKDPEFLRLSVAINCFLSCHL